MLNASRRDACNPFGEASDCTIGSTGNGTKGKNVSEQLTLLQESAHNAILYAQRDVNPKLLERFECPVSPSTPYTTMWEHIEAPEFTCLCPITGQPDFATMHVYYQPHLWCVESKSLKMYLGSYRNVGSFHEAVTRRIYDDLNALLDPTWMLVVGRFTPRGGIPFHPRVHSPCVPPELLYRV